MRQLSRRELWLGLLLIVICFHGPLAPSIACAQEKDKAAEDDGISPEQKLQNAESDAKLKKKFDAMVSRVGSAPWLWIVPYALFAALLLTWVATADWVNRDSQIHRIGWYKWNPIVFFPFALLAIGCFFIPINFYARLGILIVPLLATLIPYILVHNKSVETHQTVLTRPWWRYAFAEAMGKTGVKIETERKAQYELGAAVDLSAMGAADANADNANLLIARQSPGYLLLKDLIVESINKRAERLLLDFTQQAVSVRYEVDGVWHPGEARDRESGDVVLAVMKTLANLNIKERRKKQKGKFAAKYQGQSFVMPLTTEGTKTGERAILTFVHKKAKLATYDDLGMREGIKTKWSELMALDKGLLVLSTMPGGGLTTITDVSLDETDRLMRDFVAIEPANKPESDIQNVSVHTFDPAAGQTPVDILPNLIRTYPNVYVMRDFTHPESVQMLLDEIRDEHLVITTINARDSAEALLRLLQAKVPQKPFAKYVTGVLYQRLVRKLCETCRVGYQPPPAVLQKLGIPAGKVEQLYRAPKPEEIEENKPCPDCAALGYKGRTGIFELLEVTDQMREILLKQPKVELIRKAARAAGQRSLQEEAILLVAKGVTSLPEIQRVLK